MKRFVLLVICLVATGSVFARESEVSFDASGLEIYGTLCEPNRSTDVAAVILAGSGPTDRDGNSSLSLSTNAYAQVAEVLRGKGIASLRYDKRAIGKSVEAGMSEADITFENYIEDAVSAVEYLVKQKGYRRIILIGHSEGSLLALCAAQRSDAVVGVVSLAGAGRPIGEILHEQYAAQLTGVNAVLMPVVDSVLESLGRGEMVKDLPFWLQGAFRESVQPYMISWMKIRPAEEIAKVKVPVLIVNGDKDMQVGVENAKLLKAAKPDAELVIISNMNHTLKTTDKTTIKEQMPTYCDPKMPLNGDLVKKLGKWCRGVASQTR